jgi:hypothetical protein
VNPWRKVILEKLVKTFLAHYGNRSFIAPFRETCNLPQPNHPSQPSHILLSMIHFNNILPPTAVTYKRCPCLTIPTKTLYACLLPHMCSINGSLQSPSFQSPDIILRTRTYHECPHYAIIAAVLTSSPLGTNMNDDSFTEHT